MSHAPSAKVSLSEEPENCRRHFLDLEKALSDTVLGQSETIRQFLTCLLAKGHVLLEGLPGIAKTLLVKSAAELIQAKFQRIQFTPDLLPSDLIGTQVFNPQTSTFSIHQGPIFTELLLADEINRAPPKVQSALLEVMGEKQVTIGKETFSFLPFFMVLATQNPVEQEGTYPLPEAQSDRFLMKIEMGYPSPEAEEKILMQYGGPPAKPLVPVMSRDEILKTQGFVENLYIDPRATSYLIQIIDATRDPGKFVPSLKGSLDFGASPRASLHLQSAAKAHAFLEGRGFLVPQDIKDVAKPVLRHRLRLSYDALGNGMTADSILDLLLTEITIP